MYRPLVTIVIPVYNGSNYLNQSIQAALNQTYKNIEILVVNDGSNDDGESERIALSYGDKIRYLAKKENGGVSTALNLAISQMNGEWFSWLSHDDLYKPNKIQRQIEFLNELCSKYKNIDLNKTALYGAAETINIHGKVIKRKLYLIKEHKDQLNMILDNVRNYSIGGCAVLIPKHAFDDVGLFNETNRTVQDAEYWFRMLFKRYEFYFLNERLVQNRVHKRQVGKTKVDLFNSEVNDLLKWIADQLWDIEQYREWKNFWRLGCYMTKRLYPDAAKHSFAYVKQLMNPVEYYLFYPVSLLTYSVLGYSRNILKWVYRKLYVK